MEFDKYFKKYIWDDERTPYFVSVGRLNRRQAGFEILFFALFVGILFALVSVAALSSRLPHGSSAIVSIYAFTVVCAALLLGVSRHLAAALYCASTPLAALGYFAFFGFHPNLGTGDKLLLVLAMLAAVFYCRRLLAVVRAYPELPEPTTPLEPRRRR